FRCFSQKSLSMKPEEHFNILQSVAKDVVGEVLQTVKKEGEGLAAVKVFEGWVRKDADALSAYHTFLKNLQGAGPARTPRALDVHLEGDNAWVATEWVGAETLADFAKRQGKFEPDVAAGIGCGILDALTELHEAGLAHGGLRPSNIHLSQGFLPGGVI